MRRCFRNLAVLDHQKEGEFFLGGMLTVSLADALSARKLDDFSVAVIVHDLH